MDSTGSAPTRTTQPPLLARWLVSSGRLVSGPRDRHGDLKLCGRAAVARDIGYVTRSEENHARNDSLASLPPSRSSRRRAAVPPPRRRRRPRRRRPAPRPRPARPRPRPRARPAAPSPPIRPCASTTAATDPRSLNPQAASGSDEIEVLPATNRGLLYFDKDLKVVPELADGHAGGHRRRLDVHLQAEGRPQVQQRRPDRRGRLRAQHPQHLADPRNAYDYGYEMCYIAGAKNVLGEDFGCAGRRRRTRTRRREADVRRRADRRPARQARRHGAGRRRSSSSSTTPVNFFPNIMAMWLMTPDQREVDQVRRGGGPHRVRPVHDGQLDPQQRDGPRPEPELVAARSRRSRSHVQTFGGDPEAAVAAYEKGELDMRPRPGHQHRGASIEDPNLKAQVKDTPALRSPTTTSRPARTPRSARRARRPPTARARSSNKNFRIALTEAINKKELIDLTYGGLGTVANGSVMPGIPGWPHDYDPYPYNVDSGQRRRMATALTELGIKDTTGTPTSRRQGTVRLGKLKFGYNCDAGHDAARRVPGRSRGATNLGFSEQPVRHQRAPTSRPSARSAARATSTTSPATPGARTSRTRTTSSATCSHAAPATTTAATATRPSTLLLNQAAAEPDPTKAMTLYVQAQRLLVDDAPVIWLEYARQPRPGPAVRRRLTATASDHQNIGDLFPENIQIMQH